MHSTGKTGIINPNQLFCHRMERIMNIMEESLQMHYEKRGKIEMVSTVKLDGRKALSLAYTPGVAQPCLEIQKDVNKS